MTRADAGPSPNTVWVPTLNRSQPWHPFDATRSLESVGRGGMKSAAEPVGLAVFLGFVMLLAIFTQAMVSANRAAVFVGVVLSLR